MQSTLNTGNRASERPGTGLGAWLRPRRRLFGAAALGLGAATGLALWLRPAPQSLASRLSDLGLEVQGEALRVLGEGALVVAGAPGEPSDVHWVHGAMLDDGRLRGAAEVYNLTRSSGASERALVGGGEQVFYSVRVGERLDALERLDFRGEHIDADFGSRLRLSLSNLQRTGRLEGIKRERYRFLLPVDHVRVSLSDSRVVVDAGLSGRAEIDPQSGRVVAGGELLQHHAAPAAVPDWVPWLVDRARAVPWIGPEAIAWLELRAFGVRDQLQQAYRSVQAGDTAAEAEDALGYTEAVPQRPATASEGSIDALAEKAGWPPENLAPLLTPEVRGEGEWRPIVDDPFVRQWPEAAPLFYQAFLRGDPERPYNNVYLTAWDPRVLQLRMVSGVEEPVSATGETGPGTIPKDPTTLSRLVAAFNGGFQALHGEFGMMVEGRVYLPPKPWAATVAVFRDGRVGLGSWPGPQRPGRVFDEARAVAEIPAEMLSLRQNLTSLVEDGQVNPWGRWWWGASPSGSSEQTLTQRSALCVRDDGLMIYAWGDFLDPEVLGQVLAAAHCARAMHLDMNAGHTGLELYNVLGPGEPRAPLSRLRVFQHKGHLRAAPGVEVRARRAVTAMQMPLPRFVYTDPRDFFYLTLRPTLPGPPLEGGATLERFDLGGLPPSGYPPAVARLVSGHVRVLRLDPRRLAPAGDTTPEPKGAAETGSAPAPLVQLAFAEAPSEGEGTAVFVESVVLGPRAVVADGVPDDALLLARGPSLAQRPDARAFMGVDAHGFVVYAESDAPELSGWQPWLERLGVREAVALTPRERLGLHYGDRVWTPDGARPLPRQAGVRTIDLVAAPTQGAGVLFPETKPVPYHHWAFLQDQRVRYFRTAAPSARAPASALAPGVEPPDAAVPAP